ncbi:hypothetical protein D9M71_209050 [compost metagenome]
MRQGLWRGAEARGPVDQRSAAHGAALKDGDGAILAHAAQAFLIQAGIGFVFQQVEIAAGLQRAFFDQQHLEAGGAEYLRAGGAAGTAADHGNVGFPRKVVLQARGIVGDPAAFEALAKRVGDRHWRCSCCFQIFGGPG